MLKAGVPKELRDSILGHSLKGMDIYYLSFEDKDLKEAMKEYTAWLDTQVVKLKNVDQNVDQDKKGVKPN